MPDQDKLAKAQLQELDARFANPINREKWVTVQFNPENLKVAFANQIQQPSGSGDQNGPQAQQFVGAGSTKLTVQLWFDVNAPVPTGDTVDDVRKLTQKVAYYITPKPSQQDRNKFIPPAVRFAWGSFQFDGIMESMEESLEFFSPEGRPLRASVSISLTQQKITAFVINPVNAPPPGVATPSSPPPGTQALTQAPAGSSLQGLATNQGLGDNWQDIAQANGIENPRLLQPGQLINLNVRPARLGLP